MDRYDNPLYRWVSPAPYMFRNGWEPVYEQGVTPQALGDVARQFWDNGLSNLEQQAIQTNHPLIQEYINRLRTLREYNKMREMKDVWQNDPW